MGMTINRRQPARRHANELVKRCSPGVYESDRGSIAIKGQSGDSVMLRDVDSGRTFSVKVKNLKGCYHKVAELTAVNVAV